MSSKKSLHSICVWTFNSGKGGFVPGNIRPSWNWQTFNTLDVIKLIKAKIKSRLPENIELGLEIHYNNEFNEKNAKDIADALVESKIYLAMATPGAHQHFAYGGIGSLNQAEYTKAKEFGQRTVDLVYNELRPSWHPDPAKYPSFIIWNGSFGYDITTPEIKTMYQNLKKAVAELCLYEEKKGAELFLAIEPKPNEGHPAMLLPTVASAIVFWNKLIKEFNLKPGKKGVNKEFGHSEMIGLDVIYDTVEEIDNEMLIHMHLNSQGLNDGIILGGPGKYDIDHGVRINGINISIAALIQEAGFERWKGHDMQPRAYDSEEQALERVIRSILSWEACEKAAQELDRKTLAQVLAKADTVKAEDIMRDAVMNACKYFKELYR